LGGAYVLDFSPSGVAQSYSFIRGRRGSHRPGHRPCLARTAPLDAGPLKTAVEVKLPRAVTGRVLRFTATALPTSVQPRGSCRLERRATGAWRKLAQVAVRGLGRCPFRVTLAPGRVVVRVRCLPKAGFAASTSRAFALRIV
jgi:hypothetical protein